MLHQSLLFVSFFPSSSSLHPLSLPLPLLQSLGCVVIEMASSMAPWSEMNFKSVAETVQHIRLASSLPLIPATLSVEGQHFIHRCLARDPDTRPSASELLMHPFIASALLQDALVGDDGEQELSSSSVPSQLPPAASHPSRSHTTAAVAASVAAGAPSAVAAAVLAGVQSVVSLPAVAAMAAVLHDDAQQPTRLERPCLPPRPATPIDAALSSMHARLERWDEWQHLAAIKSTQIAQQNRAIATAHAMTPATKPASKGHVQLHVLASPATRTAARARTMAASAPALAAAP